MNWLYKNWPYAAIFTAVFLLLAAPFLYTAFGLPFTLLFLLLPIYQVHQIEEHYHDRFRTFANTVLGGGLEILTPISVFWINCLAVWVLDFILLYAALYIDMGWGLGIAYLAIFNAITHLVASVRLRRYNPGLWTGLLLFLPVGGLAVREVTHSSGATWVQQAVGIAVAVVGHALIIGHVVRRKAALSKKHG